MIPYKTLALTNGKIIFPKKILENKAIIIDRGKISGVVEQDALPAGIDTLDAVGRFISPGLIDIHIHGACGHTFNEPVEKAFTLITREAIRHGVTSILATTVTTSIQDLVDILTFSRQWMQEPHITEAEILGVHLEGPYFSLEQKGAQNPAFMRTPDDGSADLLLEHRDVIKMVSFAPELPGAEAFTARLTESNIIAAAGHSAAKENEIWPAVNQGLNHIIHIWSGQSSTIREGPWRRPGLLEATLASDTFTVEMIADNKHLPPSLMKIAYKCIGPDRLCIISDATSGAGLSDGSNFVMGGVEYQVVNGVGMTIDRTAFAGGVLFINQMIRNLIDLVDVPVYEAIRMASLNPARVLKIAHRKGSIEPGKDADIVIFEPDFSPWKVIKNGHFVNFPGTGKE